MKVFFATTKASKVSSPRRVLAKVGIELMHANIEMPELQAPTSEEIVIGKVRYAFERLQAPVIVNDSSFGIDVVKGFPGTNVKQVTEQINLDGYLALMQRYPEPERRGCEFVSASAYMAPGLESPIVSVRRERGRLSPHLEGCRFSGDGHQSPLVMLYIPDGETKTLAAMSKEELAAYRAKPQMEQYLLDLGKRILELSK